MKIIKQLTVYLVLIGLLISDIYYGFSGLGNMFITFNILHLVLMAMLLICILFDEGGFREKIAKQGKKIGYTFYLITISILVYNGWVGNSVILIMSFVMDMAMREFCKENLKTKAEK